MDKLKEVVCDTLEKRGILGKIRAQLRSHVIQAVDEEDVSTGGPGISRGEEPPFAGPESQFLAELVREYLNFQGFEHTAAVFEPEAQQRSFCGRNELANKLGIANDASAQRVPLLALVVNSAQGSAPPMQSGKPSAAGAVKPAAAQSQQKAPVDVKKPDKVAETKQPLPTNMAPQAGGLKPLSTLQAAPKLGGLRPLGKLDAPGSSLSDLPPLGVPVGLAKKGVLGSREPSPVSPPAGSAFSNPTATVGFDSPGSDDLSADVERLKEINAQIAELSQSDNDGAYDDDGFDDEEGEESMIELIGDDSLGDEGSFSQSLGDESGSDVGQNSVCDVSVSMRSQDLVDRLTRESDQVFDAERPDS